MGKHSSRSHLRKPTITASLLMLLVAIGLFIYVKDSILDITDIISVKYRGSSLCFTTAIIQGKIQHSHHSKSIRILLNFYDTYIAYDYTFEYDGNTSNLTSIDQDFPLHSQIPVIYNKDNPSKVLLGSNTLSFWGLYVANYPGRHYILNHLLAFVYFCVIMLLIWASCWG